MLGMCKPAPVMVERPALCKPALPRLRHAPHRFSGVGEPPLSELLEDPILGRLLASDGVTMDHLLELIAGVKARLPRS